MKESVRGLTVNRINKINKKWEEVGRWSALPTRLGINKSECRLILQKHWKSMMNEEVALNIC
jgi:hypothetical protein